MCLLSVLWSDVPSREPRLCLLLGPVSHYAMVNSRHHILTSQVWLLAAPQRIFLARYFNSVVLTLIHRRTESALVIF